MLMEAAQLRQIDQDYRNHLQAFLNFAVKAEKKVGKGKSRPKFDKFIKFYDYEKALRSVKKKKDGGDKKPGRFAGIGKLLNGGGGEHGG